MKNSGEKIRKTFFFLAAIAVVAAVLWYFFVHNKQYAPPDLSQYNTTPLHSPATSEKIAENTSEKLPTNIVIAVPFQPQAPFANWSDPKEESGCEEESMIMAAYAMQHKPLSADEALFQINNLADFEEQTIGTFYDSSADDTAKTYNAYFKDAGRAEVKKNIAINDIKNELAHGNIVLVPTNGQLLNNPFYKQPGPTRHMLVLRGYDDAKGIFITNDPGTKRGEGYEFPYSTVMQADLNYPTGHEETIIENTKVMVVISPK